MKKDQKENKNYIINIIKMKFLIVTILFLIYPFCIRAHNYTEEERNNNYEYELTTKVHLFYYQWYGNLDTDGQWIHWTQSGRKPPDDIASNYYPTEGAYSSANDALIEQHMEWIAETGIGVIVLTWWGEGSHEDELVSDVMDHADNYGIKVAWHLEPHGPADAQQYVEDIKYINEEYGDHPAFYRSEEYGNRPAFYVFNSLRIDDWSPLEEVNNDNIVLAQTTDQSAVDYFGGMYNYSPPEDSDIENVWISMSNFTRNNNMVWSPSIGPGYVDTRIGDNLDVSRENGKFYDNNWQWAIQSSPGWISITSFNEWHEGTQIEPASYNPPEPVGLDYYTYDGAYGLHGDEAEMAYLDRTAEWVSQWTGDEELTGLINSYDGPEEVTLGQNYPNPFNPTTQIDFTLPEATEISLKLYNMIGQHVATIASGFYQRGRHTVNFQADDLSSGMYLYRLEAGGMSYSNKMILVK